MKLNKSIDLSSVLGKLPSELKFEVLNLKNNIIINGANKLEDADENEIAWISPKITEKEKVLNDTKSKIVVCDFITNDLNNKVLIITKNPRLLFIELIRILFESDCIYSIHETSIISSDAIIESNVSIGSNTIIGKCKIGHNTIIGSNCVIEDNVEIGNNVLIKSNTVIGGKGFGYERNVEGKFIAFPHIGKVIIGDNVDIGSNCCIDRGTLGDTIIKNGSKIDNLVHIAHNVNIGENSAVIANCMIAGGVSIGNHCWIGPSTSIIEKIKIGNKSFIGIASLVLKDVPEGEVWVGSPAKYLKNNE